MSYPDVMVDIETTGTRPEMTAIIQIAAVKFSLAEGTVGHKFFDQSLMIPPSRFWDEGTREWWLSDKADILQGIYSRMRDPKTVLEEFVAWVNDERDFSQPLRFWSKPTSFDFAFISSYLHDFELGNPFHFREATDMNSWIRSRFFPEDAPPIEKELDFVGDAHNALQDTLHQVKVLFEAYARRLIPLSQVSLA